MPQDFPQTANTLGRIAFYGAPVVLALIAAGWIVYVWSPLGSPVGTAPDQPVYFSHRFHINEIGIDCRYCHASVEDSSFAGMPATETCMNCHAHILTESPLLLPVRRSYETSLPLVWNRVYDVPDHTYFHHGIHIRKGIGCDTCHGQIDEQPLLTTNQQEMTMGWCLECHREPEKYIRPREQVFNVDYHPPADQATLGAQLVAAYDVESRTSCSVCHR